MTLSTTIIPLSLNDWVLHQLQEKNIANPTHFHVAPLAGDASFRRYYRVENGTTSFIAVDAPPSQENSEPFVRIAQFWRTHEVNVPNLLAFDLKRGYLLQTDFGDTHYLSACQTLHPKRYSSEKLYQQAIDALIHIQAIPNIINLPLYDAALLQREVNLFDEWFLGKLLNLSLTEIDAELLQEMYDTLITSALSQPQVSVHRDYHSRNLMVTNDPQPGIIDFQDAVHGPITYDLVSLLRDCYIRWPETTVKQWIEYYLAKAHSAKLLETSFKEFLRWFDFMGVQRHLKAIGIFSRLKLRDNKSNYLNDIPRTLDYVFEVTQRYQELQPFYQWLMKRVKPVYQHRLASFQANIPIA